jgi:hypothetical protein
VDVKILISFSRFCFTPPFVMERVCTDEETSTKSSSDGCDVMKGSKLVDNVGFSNILLVSMLDLRFSHQWLRRVWASEL